MSRTSPVRSVSDFPLGSVWAYSNNPNKLWPDKQADAVFVITEILDFESGGPLLYCFVLDDLNGSGLSRNLGKPMGFSLGSAMAWYSVRIT